MFRRKRVVAYGVYEVTTLGPLDSTQTYSVNAIGFDDAVLQVLRVTGLPARSVVAVRLIQGIG